MFRWDSWLRVSIKPKLDSISLGVMKVVAVFFGPDDIKPSTRAGPKTSINRDCQSRVWIEPISEVMIASQRLRVQKEIPDCNQGIVIDCASIAQQTSHCLCDDLPRIVETDRGLGKIQIFLCSLPDSVILPPVHVIWFQLGSQFCGRLNTMLLSERIDRVFEVL